MTNHLSHLDISADFYAEVEAMVRPDVDYIDAIVEFCAKRGLEIEAVIPLVKQNHNLMAELRAEAEDLNFLEKSSRLPV